MKPLLILLGLVLLGGCVSQKPLEELGLVTAIGYDKEEEMLRGSIIYYEFDPLHPNNTKMVTSIANTSKGIRQKENLSSSRRLVSGQLRIAIYGRELAEQGIISIIDTLSRDAEIGTMAYLAVSENQAYELLSKSQHSKDITNAGTYLYNLISQNVETESLISPTLHEFMQSYYSKGRDPVLPLLIFKDDTIFVTGLAMFKDDKMIGVTNTEESFYLKLLLDPFEAGNVEVTVPIELAAKYIGKVSDAEEVYVSLDHLRSNTDIKLEEVETPSFSIHVKIKTRLQEVTEDLDLGDPEALATMEKEISNRMKMHLEQLLMKCQELGTDPAGFGNHYRAKIGYGNFKKEEWRKLYKSAQFNLDVDVEILRTGVMD